MKWNLQQIAKWTEGKVVSQKQTDFSELGTDTRIDLKNKIFIALKGESYDAHDYLDKAVQAGAGLLIVHSWPEKFHFLAEQVSVLQVEDTLMALQNFAHHYRKSLKAKIIGITGSNGKTTTKEFTAQILSQHKKTHYSVGSFNNHWGVPLTLLNTPTDADFAVVEMGMNHFGEITRLVQIADPDIVVCTMVGTAHIEFFGTRENIAKAKSEIYMESRPDTVRIFNQDQDLTFDMMYPVAKKFPESRMLSFSEKNNEADVYFKINELRMRQMSISGLIAAVPGEALVPVFGKQNLVNLMAAANIAYVCGLKPEQIWKALSACKTAWGRNQFIETGLGAEILFDGYNANPDSMEALLANVPMLKCAGKKIGVFGQMKELGEHSAAAHVHLGDLVGSTGFAEVYFIGEDFKNFEKGLKNSGYRGRALIQADYDESLGKQLGQALQAGDLAVMKASRGAKIERFLAHCQALNWQKD